MTDVLSQVPSGTQVGRFRGWPTGYRVDAKGNIVVTLGALPDDKVHALNLTSMLDGEVLVFEVYRIAPKPKQNQRDLDRLRNLQGHRPSMLDGIRDEDVIDLTGGMVVSRGRRLPWVLVMSSRSDGSDYYGWD